jgi:uncharacterized protein YbjQ (UPF0145 family)
MARAQKKKKPIVVSSEELTEQQGMGPSAAGQSGDLQGLSNIADADSESVEQLVEEGQAMEADAIAGVEDAPEADISEVHTRQRPR